MACNDAKMDKDNFPNDFLAGTSTARITKHLIKIHTDVIFEIRKSAIAIRFALYFLPLHLYIISLVVALLFYRVRYLWSYVASIYCIVKSAKYFYAQILKRYCFVFHFGISVDRNKTHQLLEYLPENQGVIVYMHVALWAKRESDMS